MRRSAMGTVSMARTSQPRMGCASAMASSINACGIGVPAALARYRARQSASSRSESMNIDCVSAYATDVGANSWAKQGASLSMLLKCAAWPPS